MTVDQRIEKLTERHEALAQTLELMTIENKERDHRWEKRHGDLLDMVEKLLHAAEIHEQRIERLEGKS